MRLATQSERDTGVDHRLGRGRGNGHDGGAFPRGCGGVQLRLKRGKLALGVGDPGRRFGFQCGALGGGSGLRFRQRRGKRFGPLRLFRRHRPLALKAAFQHFDPVVAVIHHRDAEGDAQQKSGPAGCGDEDV